MTKKTIASPAVLAVILLAAASAGCVLPAMITRNSDAEVGGLVAAHSVDSHYRPKTKGDVFDSKTTSEVLVSGRLAHQPDAAITVEVVKGGRKLTGFPVSVQRTGKPNPDNYFVVRIGKPEGGWQAGTYTVRVYPTADTNPVKPQTTFVIFCST